MKKYLLLAAVIVAGTAQLSFAAFATVAKSTVTAAVSFSAAGTVAMSIELRNLNGNATTTQMWWNTAGISLGQTQWRRADAYIVLHTTMTSATGAVQIYTDNGNASASPRYSGTGNPAGLVGYDAANPMASSSTLSMCWRVADTVVNSTTIAQGAPSFPDRLYSTELGNDYPCFIWMKDAGTSGFANGEDYVTVKDSVRGIQHGEATFGATPSPEYIYFGALFTNAVTPRLYKTSRLMIEAFTE